MATSTATPQPQLEEPTFGLWCGKKQYFVYKKDQDEKGFEGLATMNATNRLHYSAVRLNQSLLVFGGFTDQTRTVHNDVQIVDSATKRALDTKSNDTVNLGRYLHSAVIRYNNNMTPVMVIFGGRTTDHCCNDILELDIQKREWTCVNAIGDIPFAREGHSAVMHRDKMYIFGGRNFDRTAFFDDLYEFDFVTNVWRSIRIAVPTTTPSVGRACHSMISCEGMLLVLSGFDKTQFRTDLIQFSVDDGSQFRQITVGKVNGDTLSDLSTFANSFLAQHQRYKEKKKAIAEGTIVAAPVVDSKVREEHIALKNKIVRELIDQEMMLFFQTPTEETLRKTLILQYTHSIIKEFPLFQRQQKQESKTVAFFNKVFRRGPSSPASPGGGTSKTQKELETEAEGVKHIADLFFLSPPLMTKIEKSFRKDLRKIFSDFLKSVFSYSIKTEWERSTWDDVLDGASTSAYDEDDAKAAEIAKSGFIGEVVQDDRNYTVIMNPDGTILRKPKNLITKIITLDQPLAAYNRIRTTEKMKDLPAGYQEIFSDLRKKFTRVLKVSEVSDEHINKLRWIKRSLMLVKPLLEVMNPLAVVDKLINILLFSRVGKSGVRLTLELGKTESMVRNLKKHLNVDVASRIEEYAKDRSSDELAQIQIIMNKQKHLLPLSAKLQTIEREAEAEALAEWGFKDKKKAPAKKKLTKAEAEAAKLAAAAAAAAATEEPTSPKTPSKKPTTIDEAVALVDGSVPCVDDDTLQQQLEELILSDELKHEMEIVEAEEEAEEEEAEAAAEASAAAATTSAASNSAAPVISLTTSAGESAAPKQSTTASASTSGGAASSRHNNKLAEGDLSDLDLETVDSFRNFLFVTINGNDAAFNALINDKNIVDYSEFYYLCMRYKEKKEFLQLLEDPIMERMLKQLLRTLMPPLIKLYGNADIGRLMDALIVAIGKFIKLKDEEKSKGLRLSPAVDPTQSTSSRLTQNVATTGKSKSTTGTTLAVPTGDAGNSTGTDNSQQQLHDDLEEDLEAEDADADFDAEEEEHDTASDASSDSRPPTTTTTTTAAAAVTSVPTPIPTLVVPPLPTTTSGSAPASPVSGTSSASATTTSGFPTAEEIAANELEKERHIWNVKLEAVFRRLEEEIFLFARDVITKDHKGDRTIERLINWAFALTTVMGAQKVIMTEIIAQHGSDERVLTDVFRKKIQVILFETAKRAGAEMDTSSSPLSTPPASPLPVPSSSSASSPRKSPRRFLG